MITLRPAKTTDDFDEPGGEGLWRRVRNEDAGMVGALCSCPSCGNKWFLSGGVSKHVIHDDGRVTASVVCPEKGCEFHEFVVLEGWPGGECDSLKGMGVNP